MAEKIKFENTYMDYNVSNAQLISEMDRQGEFGWEVSGVITSPRIDWNEKQYIRVFYKRRYIDNDEKINL